MSGASGVAQPGPPGPPPGPLPVPPRRRHDVAFTLLVSVAIVLGGLVMAVVLLASGAPTALVVGLVLASLPVGPLIASFMWLDRYEPEPLGLLGFALAWGAFVATAIALVLQLAGQVAFRTPEGIAGTVVAPITEEAAKGVFVLILLWSRRHELDGILDGIVYAGMVGIGFAFTENILYFAAAYMGGDGMGPGGLGAATATFVLRGLLSPFAHPLFTVAIGIGAGYAVVTRSGFWRFTAPLLGYAVAVLAHGLWNGSVYFGQGRYAVVTYLFIMVPAFLLIVAFASWARGREGRMLTRALGDAADRGFVAHHEVPWLVRLPGRRAARRHARAVGGPTGLTAMRRYQQQAVELGFLHDRFLRGTPPPDFARRGQEMVDHLAVLRPWVRFPQPPGRTLPTDDRTHRRGTA